MPYYPVINLSERRINYINEFNNNSKIKFEKISCLNCSSVNHKILFTNDKYGLNIKTVLCKKCGLVFLNPRMTQDSADFFYNSDLYRNILEDHELDKRTRESWEEFEKLKGFSMDSKALDFNKKNPRKTFFDIINSLNLKYHSVCDIGAAEGLSLKLFQLAGKDVVGYEPSELFYNFAKKKIL